MKRMADGFSRIVRVKDDGGESLSGLTRIDGERLSDSLPVRACDGR